MIANKRVIIKVLGFITVIISIAMIPCAFISYYYGETKMFSAFIYTIIPALAAGIIIIISTGKLIPALRMREGIIIVALCWLVSSLLGAVPYYLSGEISTYADSFFEAVSGFTTTGASIMPDIESAPKGLIFWRSLSHWLGGMGILVFAISILPALGIGAQNIAKAETTGPTLDKISTRIADNAKILYLTYMGFSCIEFVLLLFCDLTPFDALIHTFGSMGTGGLSNYSSGIGYFDSVQVEIIVSMFCIFASINFIAYRHLLNGKIKNFFKEPEIRAFFMIMSGAIIVIAVLLRIDGTYTSIIEALRHSFFQVVSFMSTSGYVTADYSDWSVFIQVLLFTLLFIGGCSASTAGSIKVIRIAVMFKLIQRSLFKKVHPNGIKAVKLSGKAIPSETVSNIVVFIILYMLTFIIACLVISLENLDLMTTVSTAAATLSNTGVGFGEIGPGETFEVFSVPGRLFLSVLMLAGRLELFTIIVLLTKSFWSPNRK